MAAQSLKSFYREKADALRTEALSLRRQTRTFVVAELVSFFAAVALAVAYGLGGWGWPLLAAAGVAVLTYLWIRSRDVRSSARLEQCESWLGVYEGELASLKRFKDDVKEVKSGYECGLVFQDFNDVHEDDLIEAYIMVEVPR